MLSLDERRTLAVQALQALKDAEIEQYTDEGPCCEGWTSETLLEAFQLMNRTLEREASHE